MSDQQPDRASWLKEAEDELRALLAQAAVRGPQQYRRMSHLSALLDENVANSQRSWQSYDDAELQALLAEYSSLRLESLNTITTRAQTIVFGLAAVAALFAGPFALGDPAKQRNLTIAVFSGAVPIVSLLVLLVWVGEAMRMKRVSEYLASDIEARINRKFGRLVLAWEACLKTGVLPRDDRFGPSATILAVFFAFAVASPLIGVWVTETPVRLWSQGSPLWELWVPWIGCTAVAVYLWRVRARYLPGSTQVFSVLDGNERAG
jgi:hypothetical protein